MSLIFYDMVSFDKDKTFLINHKKKRTFLSPFHLINNFNLSIIIR